MLGDFYSSEHCHLGLFMKYKVGDEIRCSCDLFCESRGIIKSIDSVKKLYAIEDASFDELPTNIRFENARKVTKLEKALK